MLAVKKVYRWRPDVGIRVELGIIGVMKEGLGVMKGKMVTRCGN